MAKFTKGDWVQVVPTPDTKSDVWTSEHNKFCGKVGQITDVNDGFDDMLLLRVSVEFNYKSPSYSGSYSVWFQDKHLLKSSKWENDRVFYLNKKFEEYERFETSYKNKRDKILRDIFTDPYEKEREKALQQAKKTINEIRKTEEEKDMEGWIYGDGWFVKDFDDI